MRLAAKFGEPEKFAEWVTEVDEEQQQALLAEGEELCVQLDPAEVCDIAQGVADDEELLEACGDSD